MSPHRHRFSLPITGFALALLLVAGCLGQDFLDLPLGINELDHGWRVSIEPGEQLDVGLTGNAAYPEAPWQIAAFDSAVIELQHEEHETPRPPSGDPEATEGGRYDPGSLISRSGFTFVGIALGDTALRFEFVVDGEPIDLAEYEVAVVEDSCETETAAVANRCGGDFSYHPQEGLVEWDHSQQVALEPGGELKVTLTSNALYPEIPWQIAEFDSSIVAVDGPQPLGAVRSQGDYSEVDPFTSHSFLPAWSFTVRGVALGESLVVLAISVDGKRVDLFETTIVVVEDADAFTEDGACTVLS